MFLIFNHSNPVFLNPTNNFAWPDWQLYLLHIANLGLVNGLEGCQCSLSFTHSWIWAIQLHMCIFLSCIMRDSSNNPSLLYLNPWNTFPQGDRQLLDHVLTQSFHFIDASSGNWWHGSLHGYQHSLCLFLMQNNPEAETSDNLDWGKPAESQPRSKSDWISYVRWPALVKFQMSEVSASGLTVWLEPDWLNDDWLQVMDKLSSYLLLPTDVIHCDYKEERESYEMYQIVLQYCTELYCTDQYCTELYCTALYCTVLYCTALYSCTIWLYRDREMLHWAALHGSIGILHILMFLSKHLHSCELYTTLQYCTIQYSSIQYKILMYSTVQCMPLTINVNILTTFCLGEGSFLILKKNWPISLSFDGRDLKILFGPL